MTHSPETRLGGHAAPPAPEHPVWLRAITVTGALSSSVAARILQARRNALGECNTAPMLAAPRTDVLLELGMDGRVQTVTFAPAIEPAAQACMEGVLHGLEFPTRSVAPATVHTDLALRRGY